MYIFCWVFILEAANIFFVPEERGGWYGSKKGYMGFMQFAGHSSMPHLSLSECLFLPAPMTNHALMCCIPAGHGHLSVIT